MATGRKPALTEGERAQVEAAVQAAEQQTSAEIVPMLVGRSGLYREAHHRAGLLSAVLALTALLTIDIAWFPWGWHASNAVWLLGITVLAYFTGAWLGTWPAVLRLFTSRERMRHKVQMRAERAFAQQGLAHTRSRTGLLLMVSLLERQVYVLPDHALQARISGDQWQEVVSVVVGRLKAGDLAGGLCRGIEASGVLLARACPSRDGDNPNELPNAVIQDL
ncbi:MAG: TPM domain-containing protein [Nitrospira sp.]|nr:TPM domain-containing protein [Nitrospira sp.]